MGIIRKKEEERLDEETTKQLEKALRNRDTKRKYLSLLLIAGFKDAESNTQTRLKFDDIKQWFKVLGMKTNDTAIKELLGIACNAGDLREFEHGRQTQEKNYPCTRVNRKSELEWVIFQKDARNSTFRIGLHSRERLERAMAIYIRKNGTSQAA